MLNNVICNYWVLREKKINTNIDVEFTKNKENKSYHINKYKTLTLINIL